MKTQNVMIVGVGGQGSLLASKLLGRMLLQKGYDIKVSEVHGMSQRGGSVVTYLCFIIADGSTIPAGRIAVFVRNTLKLTQELILIKSKYSVFQLLLYSRRMIDSFHQFVRRFAPVQLLLPTLIHTTCV